MAKAKAATCPSCGVPKTSEFFGTRSEAGRTYLTGLCRQCSRSSTQRYRALSPGPRLWSSCKARARRLGIPFDLRVEDILIPESCPVLGIPVDAGGGRRTDNTASVDRVVPTRGYVAGNTFVISWRANRLKSDATPEELQRLAAYVLRNTRPHRELSS